MEAPRGCVAGFKSGSPFPAGFLKEGCELISEALNLFNNVYGAMHVEICACLRLLARLNYIMGDYSEVRGSRPLPDARPAASASSHGMFGHILPHLCHDTCCSWNNARLEATKALSQNSANMRKVKQSPSAPVPSKQLSY